MSKEDQFSYESMVSKIKMWRDALEQGYSNIDVFNSMCTYIGEQQREIDQLQSRINKVVNECGVNWINKTLKGE